MSSHKLIGGQENDWEESVRQHRLNHRLNPQVARLYNGGEAC
jgi:hypothetical protein